MRFTLNLTVYMPNDFTLLTEWLLTAARVKNFIVDRDIS